VAREAPPSSDPNRPAGASLGLGFGYAFPTGLDRPNVVSARVRLASGLSFEPRVELAHASASREAFGDEREASVDAVSIGATVRIPAARRGRGDLLVIARAQLDHVSQSQDDEDDLTTSEVSLAWGLAIDYWITPSFSLSATATNPAMLYSDRAAPTFEDPDATQEDTVFGAIWDPVIDAMLHLYW
jgi:hypothetical protein